MSRKLLAAACAVLVAASAAFISTPARAHYPTYNGACVVANYHARLRPVWCHAEHCEWRVNRGLAFRIRGQHRYWLLVRNAWMEGWIRLYHVHLDEEKFCRAAGMP